MNDIQQRIKDVFGQAFGDIPFRVRLRDIAARHMDLQRASSLATLREEAGDLVCSVIQLLTELEGTDLAETVEATLSKIERRMGQYQTLIRKKRIVILTGAFDPITVGHIKTIQYVLDVTGEAFDEGWLMPDFKHRKKPCMGNVEARLRACHIARRNDPRIRVSDYQIQKQMGGETFALVDSLLAEPLSTEYDFYFIMGTDNANKAAATFLNWTKLERMVPFVVVPRKGFDPNPEVKWYKSPPHIDLTICERNIPDTQSTEARRIFREGTKDEKENKLKTILDPEVLRFFRELRTYKQPR